jgi:5'-nucleotidase
MRILLTNDDGIDSIGLHVLGRALCAMPGDHEVVVVAPDREYSGAGASLGALHLIRPEVRTARIDGWHGSDVWAVSGPPALCVMFARLGAFGAPFDLVVSGINPGANVGRAVYHSGTVGAALTARNGNVSGVAVSQSVSGFAVEGQGWDETIRDQHWESAAAVGCAVVQGLLDDLPEQAVVVNVNVPDVPLDEISEWRFADVGRLPPQTMATATLEPISGHDGAFDVKMAWGDPNVLDPATDGGTVGAGIVSITYLSRLVHEPRDEIDGPARELDALLKRG